MVDQIPRFPTEGLPKQLTGSATGSQRLDLAKMPEGDLSTPQARRQYATIFLQTEEGGGYKKHQATGFVASLVGENFNLDPSLLQKGGGDGFGIAQWDKERRDRFEQLTGHAMKADQDQFGKPLTPETRFKEQLQFVAWELKNSQKTAGTLLHFATNKIDGVEVAVRLYEKSKNQNEDACKRGVYAEMIEANTSKPNHNALKVCSSIEQRRQLEIVISKIDPPATQIQRPGL